MEEVRSYWQVTGITHFCTLFGKQFKLPSFEPEELEQAFLLDVSSSSLLVNLAIALVKPHFNCQISNQNWENYLRRLVDSYWVGLEQHPSPFHVPILSEDGVELTKNLTFDDLPLSDKIDIFYALCDYRLWCEDAADLLKDFPMEELRPESIGKDSKGYEYWYFSGTRLYRENKELSQDIGLRKKLIKELEYKLIELGKTRIAREQEEKRKAELEKAKQLAAEAREARKKQQEQESATKKKQSIPSIPLRTGLRERRSSAVSNNNDSLQETRIPTTRSKVARQRQQSNSQQNTQKNLRSASKNSIQNGKQHDNSPLPGLPKNSTEAGCKEELERLKITPEDMSEAWCIQCESLEEWEQFATKFESTKSTNEKYLSSYINETLLPEIRAIYAKRAAEARRKEKEIIYSLASRRVSTRIISKKAQEEEDERQAVLLQAEMRRKKAEAESRLRAELEREIRARQNRFVVNGTGSTCSEDGDDSNCRYNLRQNQELVESDEFAGIIHPEKLSEFYEALELIVDSVRTSKHAWPFVDPVPDTVPGYYDLIDEPMDLRTLRTKIEFREYRSLLELEKDFQLIVNNCEKFNGPKNVYTKMVYKLWKSFRKNVQLYLQRDLSMDEQETFIHPPQTKPLEQVKQPPSVHETSPTPECSVPLDSLSPSVSGEPVAPTPEPNSPAYSDVKAPTPEPPCSPKEPSSSELTNNHNINQSVQLKSEVVEQQDNTTQLTSVPDTSEPSAKLAKYENLCEDIIIDSYDVTCPDETFFIWSQDASYK